MVFCSQDIFEGNEGIRTGIRRELQELVLSFRRLGDDSSFSAAKAQHGAGDEIEHPSSSHIDADDQASAHGYVNSWLGPNSVSPPQTANRSGQLHGNRCLLMICL